MKRFIITAFVRKTLVRSGKHPFLLPIIHDIEGKYNRTRDEPRCKKAVLKTCGTMFHHTDRLFRMTIQNISVEATIERVKTLIAEEKDLSPALKSSLEVLLLLVTLIVNRLGLNSKNSSKPPSMDPKSPEEAHRARRPQAWGATGPFRHNAPAGSRSG